MSFTKILQKLSAGHSVDIGTNFMNIFIKHDVEGLTNELVYMVALTIGYCIGNEQFLNDIRGEVKLYIDDKQAQACKLASVMMAMNNTYYSSTHDLMENLEIQNMKTGLEMSKLEKSGIELGDFEMLCLAASMHNKCKKCISIHTRKLSDRGFAAVSFKDIARIVAILKGAAQAYAISSMRTYDFVARDENL